jgi:hypothetical protein
MADVVGVLVTFGDILDEEVFSREMLSLMVEAFVESSKTANPCNFDIVLLSVHCH